MTHYTDEQIAQVVHAANSVLQRIHGDDAPSQPWDCETDHVRQSAAEGVRQARKGATPEQLHESWCEFKRAGGWVHGEVKNPDAKTHPCLVPYADLPQEQRDKDRLFHAIVRTLTWPDGFISVSRPLTEEQAEDIRNRWKELWAK